MTTYRKKPIEVEAFQVRYKNKLIECPDWFKLAAIYGDVIETDGDKLLIKTLEGIMEVSDKDYIIKGVKGEIYPCKPDIFEMSYDEVK